MPNRAPTSLRQSDRGLPPPLGIRATRISYALAVVTFVCVALLALSERVFAQSLTEVSFNIGSPIVTDIFVDPRFGSDSRAGTSRSTALKTVTAAWERIPQGETLSSHGYRINIMPGTVGADELPNYWESRYGTYDFPILFQAVDGVGSVTFERDVNMFDSRFVYFIGINIAPVPAGDAFHCEKCSYVLLRKVVLNGGDRVAFETFKANQSDHIYIEESTISGAQDNAVDFVAVQYGHVVRSVISNAQDWCLYGKGGSAYIRVEGNRIHSCGTGGFTAGQGAGFEFMTSPWIHYEAYDMKFINNVVHDTEGAAFGVNGGYNILIAHNTAYRVGQRSHVIEVVFGQRSCDGNAVACTERNALGGWGPTSVGESELIPNRNVFIYNNVVYNPAGVESLHQHFAVHGPQTPGVGSNIPDPVRSDRNLRIVGNVIWNGSDSKPLGVEGDSDGCQDSNPTCSATQLRANNEINTVEPVLGNPEGRDFRPVSGGALLAQASVTIPSFAGGDRESSPLAPQGNLFNFVTRDRSGAARPEESPPGAYASDDADISEDTPSLTDLPPRIGSAKCSPRRIKRGRTLTCTASRVEDDNGISAVTVKIGSAPLRRLTRVGAIYRAKVKIPRSFATGAYRPRFVVTDSASQKTARSASRIVVTR